MTRDKSQCNKPLNGLCKKILIATLLLASSLFGDLVWLDYDIAVEEAQKSNKVVMVMLSQKGCPACEYMEDIVLKDKKIEAELAKNYLVVYTDIYTGFVEDGMTYAGTPTFYFLDKEEQTLEKFSGGLNVRDFTTKLNLVRAKLQN